MNQLKNLLLVLWSMLLFSCSSPQLSDYQHSQPALKLEDFFNGKLVAHGMVLDYNGKLTRRFTADINASWQQNSGVIDEQFVYDDGETDSRVWHIQKLADGSYIGTANDVTGKAKGQSSGAAFYWRYILQIEVDGEPMEVTLDDWMFLIDDRHLLNKSQIIKYGINVGEVILSIAKID